MKVLCNRLPDIVVNEPQKRLAAQQAENEAYDRMMDQARDYAVHGDMPSTFLAAGLARAQLAKVSGKNAWSELATLAKLETVSCKEQFRLSSEWLETYFPVRDSRYERHTTLLSESTRCLRERGIAITQPTKRPSDDQLFVEFAAVKATLTDSNAETLEENIARIEAFMAKNPVSDHDRAYVRETIATLRAGKRGCELGLDACLLQMLPEDEQQQLLERLIDATKHPVSVDEREWLWAIQRMLAHTASTMGLDAEAAEVLDKLESVVLTVEE